MTVDENALEFLACEPESLNPIGFNPSAIIPYGLTTEHIKLAMQEFLDFLSFINKQLNTRLLISNLIQRKYQD